MKRKVFTDGNGSKHIFVEGLGEFSPKQDHDNLLEEVERLRSERDELIAFAESLQLDVTNEMKLEELLTRIKGEDK